MSKERGTQILCDTHLYEQKRGQTAIGAWCVSTCNCWICLREVSIKSFKHYQQLEAESPHYNKRHIFPNHQRERTVFSKCCSVWTSPMGIPHTTQSDHAHICWTSYWIQMSSDGAMEPQTTANEFKHSASWAFNGRLGKKTLGRFPNIYINI